MKKRLRLKHVSLSKKQLLIRCAFLIGFLGLVLFFAPVRYVYSYDRENCHTAPVLFPRIVQVTNGEYRTTFRGENNFIATKICVEAILAPEKSQHVLSYGLWKMPIFGRVVWLDTLAKPTVTNLSLDTPIAATKPLRVGLSSADSVYQYILSVNNTKVMCTSEGNGVECPLREAHLAAGSTYRISLQRKFDATNEALIAQKTLKTLSATTATSSSITPGSTVYDKPRQVEIVVDKQLKDADMSLVMRENGQDKTVTTKTIVKKNIISMTWGDDLVRDASYVLRVNHVEATDGSDITDTYEIPFRVSGGPTVSGVGVGKTGVATNATGMITFDQALATTKDVNQFVSIKGATARVSYGPAENQMSVQFLSAPLCTDVTISIAKGLLSKYDIPASDAWSYTMRTTCHSTETIGYSTKGRAITAYHFGNGATTILYVGAIHGNEASASYILQDYIAYLDQHAREISADRRITIVPTLNPDGLAASSRMNANNVNLNRNFATSDWKKDIKDTNGIVAGGGGSEAMSEPETKAIANLVTRLKPRLVLSYHAVGSVAIANQAGHSASMAQTYAWHVGYRNGTGASSEIFTYEISGTFDDWLAEKLGIASVVVELGGYSYRNFSHHQSAMWAMAIN